MFDVIKQIMYSNNGFLTTRMIEPINISRQYLSLMEKNKEIEKVSKVFEMDDKYEIKKLLSNIIDTYTPDLKH